MIEFLCPNGHRIRCGDERAGLAAKCPKCGVKFRIPTLDELTPSEPEEAIADGPQPGGSSGSGITPGIAAGAATGEDQIEFLCPNNHLLHGPINLQGQVGKCPECQSKFRIPSYDELEEESREERPEPEPTPPPSLPAVGGSRAPDRGDEGLRVQPADSSSAVRLGDVSPPALPSESATLASLFCSLWPQKTKGATIEVLYGDNQRLTPDRFFPAMSRGTHAVFADKESGGTSTLVVIAWNSITSITIRGVRKLPDGGIG